MSEEWENVLRLNRRGDDPYYLHPPVDTEPPSVEWQRIVDASHKHDYWRDFAEGAAGE